MRPDQKSLQKCYRVRRVGMVEVYRSPERASAAYRGLCTCQSVWQCPVCSARIAAHRAGELTAAVESHLTSGGGVALLTFTTSHNRGDSLTHLLDSQSDAFKRFWSQRAVKSCLASSGVVGRVSAQEVTFGHASGWHPHRHVLAFFAAPVDDLALLKIWAVLAPEWKSAVTSYGLSASLDRGLDVRGGTAAGRYLAKLGLEVALAVRKLGRGGRFGVWQLLDASRNGSTWAGRAFVEFAERMKGRRHLVWSRGLKSRFGIGEMTDSEIMASKAEADEVLFATLTAELWAAVYFHEIRGELLQKLGIGDLNEARQLLRSFDLDTAGLICGS